MNKVIIIMGAKSDYIHCKKILNILKYFRIDFVMRIASAHKAPEKVLDIIREYRNENCVFITAAGKSDALSGMVDANTVHPVIACPPYNDEYAGMDLFSTLRTPTGVCPMTQLNPESAALAAAKILAFCDNELKKKVKEYQDEKKAQLEKDDKEISLNG